jgi:prevent-host-death family protein
MWVTSPDRRQQKVSGNRVELRKLLEQARDGGHTVVTKHGDERAVIVPYDWLRSALPELFNDEALSRTGNRLNPARGHSGQSAACGPPGVRHAHGVAA